MHQKLEGDVLETIPVEASLDLSVVCPFYNEDQIIGDAIGALLRRLEKLPCSWELIVVNDGSTDRSAEVAFGISRAAENLRVISYPINRGRGHGLRTGIAQARGAVIVTTEIDLSWGEDIVDRLYTEALAHPEADVIVASPHLPGGGYANVPANRVFYSRFGNLVIRSFMSNAVSMNTGMTRAYRRDAIRSLPLHEDGKEFHLEVILKAQSLGYRIREIPALLEWKEYKHEGQRVSRKSSSKVNKLIVTHSLFSLFGNPIRYVWGLGGVAFALSFGFLAAGLIRYAMGAVSVYMGILSLALFILGTMLLAFGVIAQQSNMVQREIWQLKQQMWWDQQRRGERDGADREGRDG